MNSPILKKFILALSVVFIVSCDSEFNEIGSDLIDDDIHHNNIQKYTAKAVAFDKPTGAVQANNMPVNSLGVYNNPVFGKTVAHFVSQLELASENPVFYNPEIDTVYLYVPYYSNLESTDGNGNGTYTLDSVYVAENHTINLSIYENGYFLRNSDPGSPDGIQKYYSDDKAQIEMYRGSTLLNDAEVDSQNVAFVFSEHEIRRSVSLEGGETRIAERLAPGIYAELNKEFFQSKILEAPAGKLINNSVFKDYFRGLYFQVAEAGDGSSNQAMAMPRFEEGKIVIMYTDDKVDTNGEPEPDPDNPGETLREQKTLTLNLSGNTINLFENTYNDTFTSAVASSDEGLGDERLYIKGGEGSIAMINILDELDMDFLKPDPVTGERLLINEASLTFYIDQSAMEAAKEPMRIYLYDVKNRRPLFDYYVDGTTNNSFPKYNKFVHGGLIEKNSEGKGTRYKIRITNHINNIVNKDSANVTLGLVVTESISQVSNAALKTPFTAGGEEVKSVPVSSVIHPFGTVLYGSKQSPDVPEDKRLKLEIYYTKPN